MNREDNNFCALDEYFSEYNKAKFVVVPAGLEATVSYGEGTRLGPRAIIEASKNLELYDIDTDSNPAECGIHTIEPVFDDQQTIHAKDAKKAVEDIENAVAKVIADGKVPVLLGGEHTASIGAIRALAKRYKGRKGMNEMDFSVLHIDAHADMRDEFDGTKWSHACAMRRAHECGLNIVQAGIRSMSEDEKEFMDANKDKILTFFAKDIAGKDSASWIKKAVSGLRKNVYITIDADGLDPAVMPATGTPEPGGLGYHELVMLVKTVCEARNVVGFDLVELAPRDNLEYADYTAAKIIYSIMACINKAQSS